MLDTTLKVAAHITDNIEEAYRRSLSDVGQFDGIEDEVDYVINNEGYKKSIEEMTKEVLDKITNN